MDGCMDGCKRMRKGKKKRKCQFEGVEERGGLRSEWRE